MAQAKRKTARTGKATDLMKRLSELPERLNALRDGLKGVRIQMEGIEQDLHDYAASIASPLEYKAAVEAGEKSAEKALKAWDEIGVSLLAAAGAVVTAEDGIEEQMGLGDGDAHHGGTEDTENSER